MTTRESDDSGLHWPAQDRYYHIWCPDCNEVEYLDADVALSVVSRARRNLCPCDETHQEIVEEKGQCNRCGKQGPKKTVGSMSFCSDCYEEVNEYING